MSTILKQMAEVKKFSDQLKALKGFVREHREHDVAGSEGVSSVGLNLSDSTSSDEDGGFIKALGYPKRFRSPSFGSNSTSIHEAIGELNKLIESSNFC